MKNLRGYLIGGIIGGVLVFSGQALAESTSLVGKKVQAENTVVIDGQELPVKAVNIGGTTFAPLRAFSEATKKDIEFKDGTVYLSEKEVHKVDTPTIPINTIPTDIDEMTDLDQQIADIERRGAEIDNRAIDIGMKIALNPPNKAELVEQLEELRKEGRELRKQYDELIAQRDTAQQ